MKARISLTFADIANDRIALTFSGFIPLAPYVIHFRLHKMALRHLETQIMQAQPIDTFRI